MSSVWWLRPWRMLLQWLWCSGRGEGVVYTCALCELPVQPTRGPFFGAQKRTFSWCTVWFEGQHGASTSMCTGLGSHSQHRVPPSADSCAISHQKVVRRFRGTRGSSPTVWTCTNSSHTHSSLSSLIEPQAQFPSLFTSSAFEAAQHSRLAPTPSWMQGYAKRRELGCAAGVSGQIA